MTKKQLGIFLSVVLVIIAALIVGIVLTDGLYEKDATIQETMQDAVLNEGDKINLFGMLVNPGLISAYIVTAVILVFAAIVRIFVIPRFKTVPGKFQLVLEEAVGMFDGMAKNSSPHRNRFLGAYIFAAAAYIFVGTLFELFGLPWQTAAGESVALPAPLSDINGAIALGCLSYLVILAGGILSNRVRGLGRTLKGVLFTVMHALVQAYVLATLTSLIYGEVTEPYVKKSKVSAKDKHKKFKPEVNV